MTPEEAKKLLDEINRLIVTVYEQQIYGEEAQPYVMGVQNKLRQLRDYIDTTKINPKPK